MKYVGWVGKKLDIVKYMLFKYFVVLVLKIEEFFK